MTIFDGTSLKGWHVSTKTGHSGASQNKSGGKWVVKDGAIEGSQDIPGNGGLIISDEAYGDFEVSVEMNNDFGPDSGLFLRSTEDGKAWQAMIDYHAGGNLMGNHDMDQRRENHGVAGKRSSSPGQRQHRPASPRRRRLHQAVRPVSQRQGKDVEVRDEESPSRRLSERGT